MTGFLSQKREIGPTIRVAITVSPKRFDHNEHNLTSTGPDKDIRGTARMINPFKIMRGEKPEGLGAFFVNSTDLGDWDVIHNLKFVIGRKPIELKIPISSKKLTRLGPGL